MKLSLLSGFLFSASVAAAALPSIDDIEVAVATGKRTVEITYSLSGAPAS